MYGVLGIVTIIVFLVVIIFFKSRPNHPTHLTASPVVATNIRFINDKLSKTGKLNFFSGSTVAELNVSKKSTKRLESKGLFKDIALGSVTKVNWGDKYVAVALNSQMGQIISGKATISERGSGWVILSNTGEIQRLPVDQSKIIDCIIEGDTVYILMDGEGGRTLQSFSVGKDDVKTLDTGLTAVSFAGVNNGVVITRDYEGNLYRHDKETSIISTGVDEVFIDQTDGLMVLTRTMNNNTGDNEGGMGRETTGNGKTFHVVDFHGKEQNKISIDAAVTSIDNGYLITAPSVTKPETITITDLSKNNSFTIKIDQQLVRSDASIREFHIIDGFSLIGVVSTTSELSLYGPERFVRDLTPNNLPVIPENSQNIGFIYNIATNSLDIQLSDASQVEESINILARRCDCDVNQIDKKWIDSAFAQDNFWNKAY